MKKLKQSMVAIKKEQLLIILKELLHLKYILNFYRKTDDKNSTNSEYNDIEATKVKEDMYSAHSNLLALERDLMKLQTMINLLNNSIDQSNNSDIKFILIYDYITQNISNALVIMELIYKKVYQIFEEAHNQYIPKPTLGRRFSNNNLLKALKDNHQEIISLFSKKYSQNSKNLILSWNYRNYFQLEREQEHLLYINNNRYGNYINLPYWYYELPILLPSITHEAARVALLQEDSTLKALKKVLLKRIDTFLATPKLNNRYYIKEQILTSSNRLVEKILADIVALTIYKEAYLYSIFHDLAGAGLSTHFNLEANEYKNTTIKDSNFENSFSMQMHSWNFDKKRDLIIIRLHILIAVAESKGLQVESLSNFLHSIYPLSNTNRGLHRIYYEQLHYYDNYKQHTKAYEEIIDQFVQWINSDIYREIEKKTIQKKINIDFSYLWSERFKKLEKNRVLHKNEFRKLLHKTTIKALQYYADTLTGSHKIGVREEIGKPYSMTFVKIRKDLNCGNPKNCQGPINCLDCYIYAKFSNYLNCFGIYDLLKIEPTDKYEDIDRALKEVIQNFIVNSFTKTKPCKSCYIKNSDSNQNELKYFESKYSLMQIFPTIYSTEKDSKSNIHALYNIELDYTLIATKVSSNEQALEYSIKEIVDELLNHKDFFKEATIYKSLGPKDLMLLVKEIDKNDILKLNPILTKLISVKRTFTTILSNQEGKKSIKPNENYQIVSYLRVKLNDNINVKEKVLTLIDEFEYKDQIDNISLISGVLDIHIVWKVNTKTETVFELYNLFIKQKLITDFQTKFNKNIYSHTETIPFYRKAK